ncbi:ankyrin repeat-containing protein At5g02620-like [Rhododendron vialii]|uniref:ankyrin repeat-containing protein At5g02620-like n=1 Tax=Rhododendron vialii TaxID=182163 RepID=UPI00265F5C19|nr:ankyrin repeat-containing protein At5g02620-like [Rhododendron vialii]
MNPKLYMAATKGNVHLFSGIHGRSITEEEAMRIEDGIFLNRTQRGNNNILHIAARAGRDTFVAEALRRFPFLSDQVNSQGDTPLLVAARFGHLQVVKTLADPNNELPMQDDMATAVENGTNQRSSPRQRDVEEGLVDHQLDQGTVQDNVAIVENETNSSNISHRQRDVEEGLLNDQLEQATSFENGTNSRDMTTALKNETNSSSRHRPRDVEEGLDDHQLEQGTIQDGMATAVENGTNSRGMATALENETNLSSSRRPRDVEEGLDDHQLDVAIPSHWRVTNEQGSTITTALHVALKNGYQDMARYLLGLKPEMAASDNLAGESPLFLAAESRCELFMGDILLSKRPYSTKGPDGLNALHASRHCCGEIISLLIEHKPDLMRKVDNRGKAAIHHAVEAHCWDLLDCMLIADASMALFPDAEGYTPLLRAASRGYWLFCKMILRRFPESIEARNHQGQNALHLGKVDAFAIAFKVLKMPEMWELLNVGDDEGNTPLHLAVKENDYEKAMLLTSSASIYLGAVNKQGLTALDLCESDCEHYSTKRKLWFHLTRHGARHGRHPNEHVVPPYGPCLLQFPPDKDLKPYINTCALVAALIATLTFAAAFTMPGGYDTSPDNLGDPTLIKRAALRVFMLSDTLAMCCSITAVFILTGALLAQQDALIRLMYTSGMLLNIALFSTLVAFMSGMFAVLAPKASWVAILVCIVCSIPLYFFTARKLQTAPVLGTLFIPVLPRDIRPAIQNLLWTYKKMREQCRVRSLIQRGYPDTTYCASNANTVPS